MSTFYAQPHDLSAEGFYFQNLEDFGTKSTATKGEFGQPVEEYEIEYIEGDNPQLAKHFGLSQANLTEWFREADHLSDEEGRGIMFLLDIGLDFEAALDQYEDVQIFEGELVDYAYEVVEACYDLPAHIAPYFDYAKLARDLLAGGECVELGWRIWVTNANAF